MQTTNPVQGYLMLKWNSINNNTAKQKVVDQARQKLGLMTQQIEEDQIRIAETAKNIERKPTPPPPEANMQGRLKQIINKKTEMIRRLNMIQLQESRLKESTRQSPRPQPKPKSQITQEDLQTLKTLTRSYKKFERELEKKTKEYEQKQNQFRIEEKELEESHKTELNKMRRDQIVARLEIIRKHEQERQQKKTEEEKILKELKSKRMLYQQLQDKFAQQEEQEKKKIQQLKEQAKKQKQTNFEAIKDHQRSYDEKLSRQRQERANKIAEQRQELYDRVGRYPQSKFFTVVRDEEIKREEQNQSKSKLPKIFFEKRMKYAQKVKNQVLPSMKLKIKDSPKQQQNKKNRRSLSVNELILKGNEYMQQAKNIIKRAEQHKETNQSEQTLKYKNYLEEMKMNRTNRYQKSQLQKVKSMLEKDNVDQDRLQRAKLIAAKMEKNAGKSSKKLMQSIQAKLEILNRLT